MSSLTDELATALFDLDPGSLPTRAVTAQITRAIVTWAVARGWTARTEARVGLPLTSDASFSLGYVDVIVRRSDTQPDLAIEIDSTDKQWSVAKLRHAAAGGMDAIWVRWGDDEWAGVYDGIDVIQLQTLRRTASRPRSTDQLTLWERESITR